MRQLTPLFRLNCLIARPIHAGFRRDSRNLFMVNSRGDYLNFSNLRAQYKFLTKKDYSAYVDTVECNVRNNVKSFWNFVNAKRGNHGLPSNMQYGSSSASSHSAIANLFATYFGSVYTSPTGQSPALNTFHSSSNGLHRESLSITIGDIFSKLNALDINKGPGADGISPLLLKQCSYILSRPLWNTFNASLTSGVFPPVWKASLVTLYLRLGIVQMFASIGPLVNFP